jgi:pyruvate formate lyase activating enzyme
MMAQTGLLFNIQQFSLHDGPGIRTVVFFKGCPLRCKWCSNPESQKAEPCLLWEDKKNAQGVEDSRKYDLAEVVEICLRDKPFYEESGGGVTLSGGEALVQWEFAAALLRALRAEKIHTALETSGFAAPAIFAEAAGLADLLLFDLKHYDEKRHIEGTGVSLAPILANLKSALAAGRELLPRLPVIPGYNDSLEDAKGFAELLVSLRATRAQLLPFHQFGEKKYDMLKIPYSMKGVPQLRREDLEDYRKIIAAIGAAIGIDCFF